MTSTRRHIFAVALLSAAATIPVWIPEFPPMTDLPQHAAQIVLVRELLHPGFRFAPLFLVNWFTPYLAGYLLVYALVGFVGIVVACKAVVSLALASGPVAAALLLAERKGEPLWGLLCVPAMYGFNYQWGFLNFLVAAPAGLCFLLLVLRFARVPSAARGIQLALAINALFFFHAMTTLVFGAVGGLILFASAPDLRAAVRRWIPLASVAIIMIVWGMRATDQPDTHWPIDWDLGWLRAHQDYYASTAAWAHGSGFGWGRLAGIFPYVFGLRPGFAAYAAGALTLVLPFGAGARFRRDASSWMPFATLIAVLLFAPSAVFGADFVFQRFAIFLVPLYLLTLDTPRLSPGRLSLWLCAAFATVWIVAVGIRTRAYEREAAGFEDVLARIEPDARVLYFPFERDSSVAIAPTFLHYGAWYSALRRGVADPSFAVHYMELVRYVPDEEAGMRLWGFEFNPEGFDWDYFEGWKFRYFLARGNANPYARMFSDVPCRIDLRAHVNDWWLYERDPGCHE